MRVKNPPLRPPFLNRFTFIGICLVLIFSLLLTAAVGLQLGGSIDADSPESRGNYRQIQVKGARGNIRDRNGILLAGSEEVWMLYLASADMENDAFNAMLLDLARLMDRHGAVYGEALSKYLEAERMAFTMPYDDMIAWQKNPNYLDLEDLPSGEESDYRDIRHVKTTPRSFYDYLVYTKFKIDSSYSREEQVKILRLRFDIYLNNWLFSQGRPVLISADIPRKLVPILDEQNFRFRGAVVVKEPRRVYPDDSIYAAHVLGYLGEISAEEYEDLGPHGYRPTDLLGRSGLELTAERFLQGEIAYVPYQVWLGESTPDVLPSYTQSSPPAPGSSLTLTLDLAVQKAGIEKLTELIDIYNNDSEFQDFPESTAAAVMLDLKNPGAVLAMISLPVFRPQDFLDQRHSEEAAERVAGYLTDSARLPLLNRAIALPKAPGSTYKAVTAAALLESGVANSETTVYCAGYIEIDGMRFNCEDEHGEVDLDHAVAYSCNVYFYTLAVEMGIDRLAETAALLGLGSLSGIELRGEVSGTAASRDAKTAVFEASEGLWFPADTAQSAIGQGLNSLTVLQLARAAGAVATGQLVNPYIMEDIRGADGTLSYKGGSNPVELPLSEGSLQAVRDAMLLMTTDDRSTVRGFFEDAPFLTGGKTGTAESVIAGHGLTTDGLFIAFAPYDDPEVAVAVLVETGARGAPVAEASRHMFDAYFGGEPYEIGLISGLPGIK